MSEVMLSIIVPVYNHEKYIEQTLDSILMQKTSYSYEVLVGEDCSTDGTRKVLQEYEKRHPGKLTVFYRKKNLSTAKYWNWADLMRRTRGKYLITLEGDDFWTSDTKIQEQIDFLETHPEYVAVSHNCVVVDQDGLPNGEVYPECKSSHYTLCHYMFEILPGQLTTLMCRNFEQQDIFDKTVIEGHVSPGDRILYFALATNGRIYCMQKIMSAYRHVIHGGSSYSANVRYSFAAEEAWDRVLMEFAKKQGSFKGVLVAEVLYISAIFHGLKARVLTWREARPLLGKLKYPVTAFFIGAIRHMYLQSPMSPFRHFVIK